jgi:methyl-accepting chemotaxis protein
MIRFFQNQRIGVRVVIALLLPLLGMLAFSGLIVKERLSKLSSIERLQTAAKLAPQISRLVHELQKERGTSAGFLGSKGQKFADRLADQRKLSDQENKAYATAVALKEVQELGGNFPEKRKLAETALSGLDAIRGKIDKLEVTGVEAAAYFTSSIGKLVDMTVEMAVLSTDTRMTSTITAYVSLMQAKERVGIERAMGSNGFSAGKFAPPIFKRFIEVGAEQESFLWSFRSYANEAQRKNFTETVSGKEVDEVARMRKIAIDSPQTNDLGGIEGPVWFDTITIKINLMKNVEDQVAQDLGGLAMQIHDDVRFEFMLTTGIAIALLLLTGFFVTFIVRGITLPLASLTGDMSRLASGDKSFEVKHAERLDEIGDMARALSVFRMNMLHADKLEAEARETQKLQLARAARIEKLSIDFEKKAEDLVRQVVTGSGEILAVAQKTADRSQASGSRSLQVGSAAADTKERVAEASHATQDLIATIKKISGEVERSDSVAGNAVAEVETAVANIDSLSETARQIDNVVQLINDIAGQTNLLALNATIEAARAGEAGKGFAVVANEVKSLANQTAKATQDITSQVQSVQHAVSNSVQSITRIREVVQEMSSIAKVVAASVHEQERATGDISRSIEQVDEQATLVATSVASVARSSASSCGGAISVIWSVKEMGEIVHQLDDEMKSFLSTISKTGE